jgi:nicotinate-nucleotide pyrophosphorylase (carboxylating)
MPKEFPQIEWDELLIDDCRQLVRLAVREDLDRQHDWTTLALVPESVRGAAEIVARQPGVAAGLAAAELAAEEMNLDAGWQTLTADGQAFERGAVLARLEGSARDLLTAERLLLNLIGRLTGIATLTRRYVDAVSGLPARIYDTRKTTPGWRRLEKYAVRCGGGMNHRLGLFEAVLIKDNHLALGARASDGARFTPAESVAIARRFIREMLADDPRAEQMIVEVEVDSLEQLAETLPVAPDIILLDNMTVEQLGQAVAMRNAVHPGVELEASGGINLDTVRRIAETGVDRISVGALTHSAISLDVGLDWRN